MDAPKTHEEMAERIGIWWWEGHNEGARKQLAKYVLAALNEATAALREENARLRECLDGVLFEAPTKYAALREENVRLTRERDEARDALKRLQREEGR